MFKKHLLSAILIWLGLFFVSIWAFSRVSENSEKKYLALMNENTKTRKELKEQPMITKQIRTNVSKQILYKQSGERLQTRLKSINSELLLKQKITGLELIENFQALECLQQENLFSTPDLNEKGQNLRYMQTRNASYSYKTGICEAQNVKLYRYRFYGDFWPDFYQLDHLHPFFKGEADKVTFILLHEPNFKAEGLQAIFSNWDHRW